MQTLKWYQQSWGIVLLIVVFFPVGLYQMWKHAKWHFAVKTGVTLFYAFLLFGKKPEQQEKVISVDSSEVVDETPVERSEETGSVSIDRNEESTSAVQDEVDAVIEKIEFKVESVEPMGSAKANINIRLMADATKEELTGVAKRLRREHSKYQNLFIFYYLRGQSRDDMAWATSHYNPDLSVRILGSTAEQSREIEQLDDVPGTIQGAWKSNMMGLSMVYILYEKERKQWAMRIKLAGNGQGGAQSADLELTRKRKKGVIRYISQSRPSEYYVINSDGKLSSYDESGLIETMISLSD
jgi:hypothetical protein